MNAAELFKAGKLSQAIEAQVKEVKANAADRNRRLFLFEMLAFAGDLDRATRQIDVLKYEEIELEAAVQSYRTLVEAEKLRRRLFSESLKPQFFAEMPDHVGWRLEAINRLRENQHQEALNLLERSAAATPAFHGRLNGKLFEGLRDCDDLFGTVLEVMAHGHYYWVPFEQIELIALKAPRFPRDLLWLPVRLEMTGAAGDVFLPALYPGSYTHSDDQVKLGRMTDWQPADGGPVRGFGARTFLVGDDAINILEWRELILDKPA